MTDPLPSDLIWNFRVFDGKAENLRSGLCACGQVLLTARTPPARSNTSARFQRPPGRAVSQALLSVASDSCDVRWLPLQFKAVIEAYEWPEV